MRLVCHTLSVESFSEEDAIQILAKSGFDAIDWSFFRMKNRTMYGIKRIGVSVRRR